MKDPYAPSGGDPKFFALIVLVLLCAAGPLDFPLASSAARASPGLVRIGLLVSDFGLSGYMFAISAAVAIGALWARTSRWGRTRRLQLTLVAERAVYFFVVIAASGLLAQLIKHVVGRARPKLLAAYGAFHFDPLSWKNVLASFPSGHSTSAFAAAVALGLMFPRGRVIWLLIAALIAASRVLVGAHYPSDVVGGAALGTAVAYLLAHAFARRSIAFDPTSPTLRLKRAVRTAEWS